MKQRMYAIGLCIGCCGWIGSLAEAPAMIHDLNHFTINHRGAVTDSGRSFVDPNGWTTNGDGSITNIGRLSDSRLQTDKKLLRGQVSDSTGSPVEYATAVLLKGETQVGGAVTDSTGSFSIEAVPGDYALLVQFVGYDAWRQSVQLPMNEPLQVQLHTSEVALGEVVVRATQLERKGDRFVLSVLPQTGKDGSELLREAPGVWFSTQGVSINGMSGTKVFLDDRELHLEGEELVRYLHSLRADEIRSIEVIPIAGAEYEASARGGVIRISLRHRRADGVQGHVTMETAQVSGFQSYNPSAAVQARVGRWNWEASGSGDWVPRDELSSDDVRLYADPSQSFHSQLTGEELRRNGQARLAALFEADSLNTLGAELEYVRQHSEQASVNDAWLTSHRSGGETTHSVGQYAQRQAFHTIAATANWIHKLDGQGSLVKFIGNYLRKSASGNNRQQARYEQTAAVRDTTYRMQVEADYDLATADLAFRKQLSQQIGYQLGAKYTYTLMDDASRYEALVDSRWKELTRYRAELRYHEHITGAYGSFSGDWGAWSLQAGLRLEYVNTADQSGSLQRDYLDLFPNLSVTRAFDPARRLMLIGQYRRNIERPAFSTLNPNRIQRSEYNYVVGNPLLKPTYIHHVMFTWVYAYRYTLTMACSLHRDLVRENALIDSENPDASYVTYLNQDRENHWFVVLGLPFEPTPWFKLNINMTGVRQQIRAEAGQPYVPHWLGFANVTATVQLPQGFSFETRYAGQSRLYSGTGEIAPFHTVGVAVRKKLFNDRWLLTAHAENLFDAQYGFASHLPGYDIQSQTTQASVGRHFKVSLSWHFQSGKRVDRRQLDSANEAERNRLK